MILTENSIKALLAKSACNKLQKSAELQKEAILPLIPAGIALGGKALMALFSIIAAKEAYNSGKAGFQHLRAGDTSNALRAFGHTGLNALFAIPGLGSLGRIGKGISMAGKLAKGKNLAMPIARNIRQVGGMDAVRALRPINTFGGRKAGMKAFLAQNKHLPRAKVDELWKLHNEYLEAQKLTSSPLVRKFLTSNRAQRIADWTKRHPYLTKGIELSPWPAGAAAFGIPMYDEPGIHAPNQQPQQKGFVRNWLDSLPAYEPDPIKAKMQMAQSDPERYKHVLNPQGLRDTFAPWEQYQNHQLLTPMNYTGSHPGLNYPNRNY